MFGCLPISLLFRLFYLALSISYSPTVSLDFGDEMARWECGRDADAGPEENDRKKVLNERFVHQKGQVQLFMPAPT